MTASRRSVHVVWALSLIILIAALTVAGFDEPGARTTGERVEQIAATIKCPTCVGQSVAQSDAPASLAIRADIERRIGLGETDADIRRAMAARFGTDILLSPSSSGLSGLVWLLPLAAAAACLTVLAVTLRRWLGRRPTTAPDDDRRLVAASLTDWNAKDEASSPSPLAGTAMAIDRSSDEVGMAHGKVVIAADDL